MKTETSFKYFLILPLIKILYWWVSLSSSSNPKNVLRPFALHIKYDAHASSCLLINRLISVQGCTITLLYGFVTNNHPIFAFTCKEMRGQTYTSKYKPVTFLMELQKKIPYRKSTWRPRFHFCCCSCVIHGAQCIFEICSSFS